MYIFKRTTLLEFIKTQMNSSSYKFSKTMIAIHALNHVLNNNLFAK